VSGDCLAVFRSSDVATSDQVFGDISGHVSFPLDQPYLYPTLNLEYQSAKEKNFTQRFDKYVSEIVHTKLDVNSAILHSMAHITGNVSIYDILSGRSHQWVDHCKEYHLSHELLTAGIHSIKKKYCDFHMNFGDRIDIDGQIHRKRIPCASWFDSDCANFSTDRAISRILNYAWDTPHSSMVFTLDPAGWDLCSWDNINDFCQLVADSINLTINQHFKHKHRRIKGNLTAGIIIIPHTFSSLDPTKWQPHFNVIMSCKGVLDQSGAAVDISYIDYNLLRKNYKELLEARFGLYRPGNYQINVSEHFRTISDNTFVDILRYNKRAPVSDADIICIHDTGVEFTNYKRESQHEPNLFYSFETFFNGILQHLPPKNRVQIHRYGLYHQNNKNFKNYPLAFDSSQTNLSDYDGKTWLWTAYSGRVVAYNSEYLFNNVSAMGLFNLADQNIIVSLIEEDRHNNGFSEKLKSMNKNSEICRILTPIVYTLRQKTADPPDQHKEFSFFPVFA